MGHWLIYENSEINGSQMACRSQVTIWRSRDIDHGHDPRYSGSTGWHYCTRRLVHGNGTALGTADNFLWTSEYAERHFTRKTFGVSTWGVMIDWTGEKGQIQDWNLPRRNETARPHNAPAPGRRLRHSKLNVECRVRNQWIPHWCGIGGPQGISIGPCVAARQGSD